MCRFSGSLHEHKVVLARKLLALLLLHLPSGLQITGEKQEIRVSWNTLIIQIKSLGLCRFLKKARFQIYLIGMSQQRRHQKNSKWLNLLMGKKYFAKKTLCFLTLFSKISIFVKRIFNEVLAEKLEF